MTILGVDTSHYQGLPNWAQVKASGRPFGYLKATEGVGFIDPTMAANRKAAHAAGLIVGLYHFARAGDPVAEARYFLKVVGALQVGEFLVLDQEVPNTVAWCKTWLDTVYAATGVRPLIYMNQSASTGVALGNWAPVAANYGLILAKYDNAPATVDTVPHWGSPAMKQYSDRGTVPGIGACDVDVFYGTEAQLLAYGKGGAQPAPTAIGAPDMRLARTPDGTIWAVTDTEVVPISDVNLFNAAAKVWGQPVDVTPADITLLTADCNARPRLVGYGQRIERIDEGAHGGWGYGTRIEDTQTKVDALGSGATVDAAQVATLVLAGIKAQMAADVPAPPVA